MNASKPPLPRPPIFMLIFMFMFGFIGLGALIFVWLGTDRNFPALIFKLVASFIAIAFMAMGFGSPITMLKVRKVLNATNPPHDSTEPPVKVTNARTVAPDSDNRRFSPAVM